jgi:hypothetical protein
MAKSIQERLVALERNLRSLCCNLAGIESTPGPQGIPGPQGLQGVQGEQGIQGETGAALTVLGSYPDLGSFLAGAGNSPGNPGEAWLLESDGSLMIWNTATNAWEDVGDLQGPQGLQGIQGVQGEQGPQGVPGIQGIQGNQGDQGTPGADALWNFMGEWANGVDYLAGSVVEFNGSSYYAPTFIFSSYSPPNYGWLLVSSKGDQGVQGISGTSGLETWVRYSPIFQATGMTFTGSGVTYPTYNSYYVKAGLLVSFVIEIDFTTVTNFGTGQYKVALPFAPAFGYNHFSGWIWADPDVNPDTGTGHTILNADTAGITTVLDLHYLKQSGGANSPIREGLWVQGTPVPLTTISKAYINGTYICVP